LVHTIADASALQNLLEAWREFEPGKRAKPDVQAFGMHLLDNLWQLHVDLASGRYRHGHYERFIVSDPKARIIHKASVRDRVVHRALYRLLYPFFDRTFIDDSYSCRVGKGTHRALDQFTEQARRLNRNNTRTVYVLKADVRKFFASINHARLRAILTAYIPDPGLMRLVTQIIDSFSVSPGTGLPLGNLTSQLFCNVYLNQLDQFIKHRLKVRYYVRYADDFLLMSTNRPQLEQLLPQIATFLHDELCLELHPDKVWIKTVASGVDFLGWVHFPHHRILRASTRKRLMHAATKSGMKGATSYLGLLRHGNTLHIRQEYLNNLYLVGKED
jgi:RNA-directed DNA polymerase